MAQLDPLRDNEEVTPRYIPTLREFDVIGITMLLDDTLEVRHNGEVFRVIRVEFHAVVFCGPCPAFRAMDDKPAGNLRAALGVIRLVRLGAVPRRRV